MSPLPLNASYWLRYYRSHTYNEQKDGLHPLRMSLDGIFPLWNSKENKYFIHHVDNVGLTAEYLNRAKSTDIHILLTIASDAVNSANANADTSKIKQLELGFDHCFLIRIASLSPKNIWSISCRLPSSRKAADLSSTLALVLMQFISVLFVRPTVSIRHLPHYAAPSA